MGFKKYAKKQGKRIYGYAKKRYAPHGKVDIARIAKDVSMVKGLLNVEMKAFDQSVTNTTTTLSSPSAWPLVNVAQGNFNYERNGQSLKVKSLQIKGSFTQLSQGIATGSRVRFIVVIDKEPLTSGIGNLPAFTDIYSLTDLNSLRNFNSILQKRFTILYDRMHQLDADDPEKSFTIYKKMNMVVKYQGSAGNTVQNNNMFVYAITDMGSVGNFQIAFNSRICYVDN